MADDKKISDLTAAGALSGAELVEVVQGGVNKKSTAQDIADLGGAGVTDGDKGDVVVSGSGATWTVDSASATQAGKVELATPAEAIAGTDTERAVTPEGLSAAINDSSLGFNPADELTEIAGITLESDITAAQLLQALAIPISYGIHVSASVPLTMTNMPSAETVLVASSAHYVRVEATNYRQARLACSIITMSNSANNPRMYLKYSINGGGAWVTLGAGTTASGDAINFFTGSAGVQVTNWIDLPAEVKGDFLWRVVTIGGDGVIDLPVIGNIHIQFRT